MILRYLYPQDIILNKLWIDYLYFVKALPRIIKYAKEEKTSIKFKDKREARLLWIESVK